MSNEIEILKEAIASRELILKVDNVSDDKKKELAREINDFKDTLITSYRDISYSPAMTFREYGQYLKTLKHPEKHSTGVSFLDDILGGGVEEETFINIIGESGAGKSTFAINLLLNVAKHTPSYFVSLEMGKFKTFNKIESLIKTDEQRDNLYVDIWTRGLDELVREIELFSHNGVKFFVIDSKMKIEVTAKSDEHQKIAYLSNTLSQLTQRLGVIIILINQMSEESIKNGRVAIKGSGDQKYDTDILIAIEKNKKDNNTRVLNLAKNRQTEIETTFVYTKDFTEYSKEPTEIIYNEGGFGL